MNAEMKTFDHHDKIAETKEGDFLIVSEPFSIFNCDEGGVVDLVKGNRLRAMHNVAGIRCKFAKDGKVINVCLAERHFHCVNIAK